MFKYGIHTLSLLTWLSLAEVVKAENAQVLFKAETACAAHPFPGLYWLCTKQAYQIAPAALSASTDAFLNAMPARTRLSFSHQCKTNTTLVARVEIPGSFKVDLAADAVPGNSFFESLVARTADAEKVAISVAPVDNQKPVKAGCFFQLDSNISMPLESVMKVFVQGQIEQLQQWTEMKKAVAEATELPATFVVLAGMPDHLDEQVLAIDGAIAEMIAEKQELEAAKATRVLTENEQTRYEMITAAGGAIEQQALEKSRLTSLREDVKQALTFAQACSQDASQAFCVTAVNAVEQSIDQRIVALQARLTSTAGWLASESERLQSIAADLAQRLQSLSQEISNLGAQNN